MQYKKSSFEANSETQFLEKHWMQKVFNFEIVARRIFLTSNSTHYIMWA